MLEEGSRFKVLPPLPRQPNDEDAATMNIVELERLHLNPVFQFWVKDVSAKYTRALIDGNVEWAKGMAQAMRQFEIIAEGILTNQKKAKAK